jgi:hypothetical protein
MFIHNGRLNGDKDGNFTCKGTSVVFYWSSSIKIPNQANIFILRWQV